MSFRTCAADGCKAHFKPYLADQLYCSHRCGVRMRVRRFRERQKFGGGDDGGGRRQRALFPKPLLAKPPKSAPAPQPSLFAEPDLLATYGGIIEYLQDGSVSDKNRYSVKQTKTKAPFPA